MEQKRILLCPYVRYDTYICEQRIQTRLYPYIYMVLFFRFYFYLCPKIALFSLSLSLYSIFSFFSYYSYVYIHCRVIIFFGEEREGWRHKYLYTYILSIYLYIHTSNKELVCFLNHFIFFNYR